MVIREPNPIHNQFVLYDEGSVISQVEVSLYLPYKKCWGSSRKLRCFSGSSSAH